ncbi:hypothetical protein BJ912DRAFT_966012 [Pholiota molesta]|nr:hypothetical protein BJ912DRAFT_966012 [Pholiota molesta]
MTTHNPQPTAPPPSSVLFARGVIARLAIWSTLRIAVQENWGGPDAAAKRTWLASEILLLQVMADEFEAVSVAKDIVQIWDETRVGRQELGKKANAQEKVVSDEEGEWEDEEGEDDDESDEEVPQLLQHPPPKPAPREPEVDEDGFTMVKGKNRR